MVFFISIKFMGVRKMNELEVMKIMNEATIKVLMDKKLNYSVNAKIREKLKDEAFFFKIEKKKAYDILSKIGVKRDAMDNVYIKLISPENFYVLIDKRKIKENDKDLVIKYNTYRRK